MKIIHTGDIHLDSPFTSSNPVEAEKRRNALRSAFSSLMLYAKTQKCELFIVAGDLFDDDCVTKDTINVLCKEMESVCDCHFIIAPSNHDPYTEKSAYYLINWPENVHIFKTSEISFFDIPSLNVRIYGSAYLSETKEPFNPDSVKDLDNSKINILIHHGDLDTPSSPYSPIKTQDIENSGFDYVALGHIHKGCEIKKAGTTFYAYCGCIEGRDFGECGYKGAISGVLEKGNADLKHVRFCSKRYEIVEIDVTGCDDLSAVLNDLITKCSDFGEDTLLRIELTGIVSESFSYNYEDIRKIISRPSYLEIKDNTSALFNIEKLKQDKTLAGEFYRILEPKLFSDDESERENASLALKYGLRAIYGMEIKA